MLSGPTRHPGAIAARGWRTKLRVGELGVGDSQFARAEMPAAPQHDVEIEHARTPAAAGATAELTLDEP